MIGLALQKSQANRGATASSQSAAETSCQVGLLSRTQIERLG